MILFRAERTDESRLLMGKSVSYHLVLTLESFSTLGSRTTSYRAKVRSFRRVQVFVTLKSASLESPVELSVTSIPVQQICCFKRRSCAVRKVANVRRSRATCTCVTGPDKFSIGIIAHGSWGMTDFNDSPRLSQFLSSYSRILRASSSSARIRSSPSRCCISSCLFSRRAFSR